MKKLRVEKELKKSKKGGENKEDGETGLSDRKEVCTRTTFSDSSVNQILETRFYTYANKDILCLPISYFLMICFLFVFFQSTLAPDVQPTSSLNISRELPVDARQQHHLNGEAGRCKESQHGSMQETGTGRKLSGHIITFFMKSTQFCQCSFNRWNYLMSSCLPWISVILKETDTNFHL